MTGHVTIIANGVIIHADAAVSDPITHDVQLTGNVHATFTQWRECPSGSSSSATLWRADCSGSH